LETRIEEHIRDIESHQTDKSAVLAHVWKEGQSIEEAKLLKNIQTV
jgi:hypothetical protein